MPNTAAAKSPRRPSGPLANKSDSDLRGVLGQGTSAEWRRQRLLNIGVDSSSSNARETTPLSSSVSNSASYGTLPTPKRFLTGRFRSRKSPSLPPIETSSTRSESGPRSWSPNNDRSLFRRTKTISAYDAPASAFKANDIGFLADSRFSDTKLNGIRVWYSSFSSVDWLHDAIKESSRLWRLQSRKSTGGRLVNALDRSVDWITVTIVGFLTAIVAFFIVRGEQWLFDLKEGICLDGWWRSRSFCNKWESWAGVFGVDGQGSAEHLGPKAWLIEYIIYTLIAVTLATIASLLTIHLTASPSFVSNKDSGVLSPEFSVSDKPQGNMPSSPTKRRVMYYAGGSGIPEIKTILSGFVIHGYLGGRTLFTKAVGLAFSVASGLSLGKEGPFVHIASCIGNIVSRYFPKYETNEGKRREVLSAAAAAGVAVAFGAPIGGVLFSLEEVSYYFPPKVMWQSFFCAMIAAVTLRFLDPFGTGKLVLFQVTYDKDWHAYELVFFLLLGIFGVTLILHEKIVQKLISLLQGVYGAYFSKLNYRWSRHVRNGTWLKTHAVSEVMLVTLATTLLCFLNPYTRMGGTELVYNLFSECRPDNNRHEGLCPRDPIAEAWPLVQSIGVALLVKGALTIVTFGIKLPAGIFIPTLGVGACFGRIMGIGVQYLRRTHPEHPIFEVCNGDPDCVVPGLYAMVGAAATLSGVTRTTVSLAVIMFELTDTLTYTVPVMLSILTAKTVADYLEPKGIYDLVIDLSQLPYLDSKRQYIWGDRLVSDVMDRGCGVIRTDEKNTVKALYDKLRRSVSVGYADSGFPILKGDQLSIKVVGYIGMNELEHALAIVADDAERECYFNSSADPAAPGPSSSISSLDSSHVNDDPFDFTLYIDQAPLTIQTNSPLELVQQLFAKLGAKYVIVTDPSGHYEGVIEKNAWIAFLNNLENDE